MRFPSIDIWEIEQLLSPSRCIICNRYASELCLPCSPTPSPMRVRLPRAKQPLLSSLIYDDHVAKIVLAAKEDNSRVAQFYLAKQISALVAHATHHIDVSSLLFISVPSTSRAITARGYVHMDRITRFLTSPLPIVRGAGATLQSDKRVRDQSKVHSLQRSANVQGGFSVRRGSMTEIAPDVGIILLDDVVTTGSSMRESIRALNTVGIEPDALISACISPRLASNRMVPS